MWALTTTSALVETPEARRLELQATTEPEPEPGLILGRNRRCQIRAAKISRECAELRLVRRREHPADAADPGACTHWLRVVALKNGVLRVRPGSGDSWTAVQRGADNAVWLRAGGRLAIQSTDGGEAVEYLAEDQTEAEVLRWIQADQTRWWPYHSRGHPDPHLWVKCSNSIARNCLILQSGGVVGQGVGICDDGRHATTMTPEQALHRLTPGLPNRVFPEEQAKHAAGPRVNGQDTSSGQRKTLADKWPASLADHVRQLRAHLVAYIWEHRMPLPATTDTPGDGGGGGMDWKRRRVEPSPAVFAALGADGGGGGASDKHTYAVYLALDEAEASPAYSAALDGLAKQCDSAVHKHCYQQNGTRHVTLCETPKLTAVEADAVRFRDSAMVPALPFPVGLPAVQPWYRTGGCVALEADLTSSGTAELQQLVRGNLVLPGDAGAGKKPNEPHISLYRPHQFGNVAKRKEQFKAVGGWLAKRLEAQAGLGAVTASQIRMKRHGGRYSDYRVLAE